MNLGIDDQGRPVCQPFLGLDDVLSWKPPYFCCNGAIIDTEWKKPQMNRKNTTDCRPQLLACHDMQGGYLDDRFTQGTDNPNAYRFYQWNVIDTFIYFSHSFVTIPPFGWICTAHRHGVNILGTIITEWEHGANICKVLLQSKEYIDSFISKLVEIMLFYGFDGWLINIENDVEPSDISLLLYFAQELTNKCHSHLHYSQVIWYDSVIRSGKLIWQDELNDENEMFFQVCDGIFLNYALTNEKLERTSRKAKALNRQHDVYAGVDAFGRCTPGGGGFNSKQMMKTIHDFGLSCALFAQGWAYECLGFKDFDVNERKFWFLLNEYLPMKSASLPLSTSFCHGYGKKFYIEGKVVSENGWHNLSLQQFQPTFPCEMELNDAYFGGGCLKLFSHGVETFPMTKRLFRIHLKEKESIKMSVTWKVNGSRESCYIAFALLSDSEQCSALFLVNDSNVDKSSFVGLVESSLGYNSLKAENVKYVCSKDGTIRKNNEWTESSFCFDTDSFIECCSENCNFDLLAMLLPKKVGESEQAGHNVESVLMGHLSMHAVPSSSSEDLFPSSLGKGKCLSIETSCPISPQNISTIVSHKCFFPPPSETDISRDLESVSNELEDTNKMNKQQGCLKLHNCENDNGANDVSPHISLWLLHWTYRHSENMDYYIIFTLDNSGNEHFIGASVSNYYVLNAARALCSARIFILPIQRGRILLGQKVFLDFSIP